MNTMPISLASLGCAFGFTPPVDTTLTALRALKIAQRRLRFDVRGQLLSITSTRTDASFVPEAWRFEFLDEATTRHCRVVIVAAQVSSDHRRTVRAFKAGKPEGSTSLPVLPLDRLHFDSNQILEQARGISKLKGSLSAEYRLRQPPNGGEMVWHLSFYAEATEPIATFEVNAKTGEIQLKP